MCVNRACGGRRVRGMSEDPRDLWLCSRCGIGIAPDDVLIEMADGTTSHVGFDSRPCGPVLAQPAQRLQ